MASVQNFGICNGLDIIANSWEFSAMTGVTGCGQNNGFMNNNIEELHAKTLGVIFARVRSDVRVCHQRTRVPCM